MRKKILGVYSHGSQHWVGDGFHVRNFFPSHNLDRLIDPFLLLDYAGPTEFPPTTQPRGVGEHPHRGFETVTIVYHGAVAHGDSAGNKGSIGPGDVQWMTAASGVVHEEMLEPSFLQQGGTLEMIQLWVNLPKAHKMSAPGYQTLLNETIPKINLADDAGFVRVIAGDYAGKLGPAKTFTAINLYDVFLKANNELKLTLPENFNTGIFILSGSLTINEAETYSEATLVLFEPAGEEILLTATTDSQLLILNGQAIQEPIVRQGPFVMNTEGELKQAFLDFRSGKMGQL